MPRKKTARPRPLALIVLEGFGVAPANPGNAISEAQPTFYTYLINHYPAVTLSAAGEEIGLEPQQPGSAETGFGVIGSGRAWTSPRLLVDRALADKTYEASPIFSEIKRRVESGGRLHLVGVVSTAETMSSFAHLEALIAMATSLKASVDIHVILDGVDASASGGETAVARLQEMLVGSTARIASLSGRWYALDRKGHATRLDKASAAIARANGLKAESAIKAIASSYRKKIFDEEFAPTVLVGSAPVAANDAILFFNFRSGGLEALAERFNKQTYLATLVDYGFGLPALVAGDTAGHYLASEVASHGFRQLRLADSESFAAVTSFFDSASGPFEHEQRHIVATTGDSPAEAAAELAREFAKAVESGEYDLIVTALPQADRAAHTGQLETAIESVRAVDAALEVMVDALLKVGGGAVITASHAAAERAIDFSGVGGAHTTNPVPLLLVGNRFEGYSLGLPEAIGGDLSLLKPAGSLLDVAPTVLSILGLRQPNEMPGRSLVA